VAVLGRNLENCAVAGVVGAGGFFAALGFSLATHSPHPVALALAFLTLGSIPLWLARAERGTAGLMILLAPVAFAFTVDDCPHVPIEERQAVSCQINLGTLERALEQYSIDNEGHYPVDLERLTPKYLKTLPTCPATGECTYAAGYKTAYDPDAFTVRCFDCRNVVGSRQPPNFPGYGSEDGLARPPGSGFIRVASFAPSLGTQWLLLVLGALACVGFRNRGRRGGAYLLGCFGAGVMVFALVPWNAVAGASDASLEAARSKSAAVRRRSHATCARNLAVLSNAVRLYRSTRGATPATLKALVPSLRRDLPRRDPVDLDSVRYEVAPDGSYTIYCTGKQHRGESVSGPGVGLRRAAGRLGVAYPSAPRRSLRRTPAGVVEATRNPW